MKIDRSPIRARKLPDDLKQLLGQTSAAQGVNQEQLIHAACWWVGRLPLAEKRLLIHEYLNAGVGSEGEAAAVVPVSAPVSVAVEVAPEVVARDLVFAEFSPGLTDDALEALVPAG